MIDVSIYGEQDQKIPAECRHCYGGGWVLDQVETTFGEFEDVSYLCGMCLGTGKAMSRAERIKARARR